MLKQPKNNGSSSKYNSSFLRTNSDQKSSSTPTYIEIFKKNKVTRENMVQYIDRSAIPKHISDFTF